MRHVTLRRLHSLSALITLALGPAVAVGACSSSTDTDAESQDYVCHDYTPTDTEFTCVRTLRCDEALEYKCMPLPAGEGGGAPEQACGACDDYECVNELCAAAEGFCYSAQVECGPDPEVTDQCCYLVRVKYPSGRPFTVAAEARTAAAVARDDWSAALAPNIAALDETDRRALADAWTRDGLAEHASIAAFARFVLQLLALGAPSELVRDAQRALRDEVEHARLCFGLASAYAGEPRGPGALAIDGAIGALDMRSIVLAAVAEGCVGETLSAAVATVAASAAEDPAARRVLARIAADESRHAVLAWRFVQWALAAHPELGADVAATVAGATVPEGGVDGDADALLRHGQLSRDEYAAVAQAALAQVVRPALRRLLGGAPGWASAREHRVPSRGEPASP